MNLHTVGQWAAIVGVAAGVYFPLHSELKSQREEVTQQAVQRQQRIDTLNRRLDGIDNHLQFIDETLPAHDKALARRVFNLQMQLQQVQQAQSTPPTLFEYSKSVIGHKAVTLPAVSADVPAIEKPKETPQ